MNNPFHRAAVKAFAEHLDAQNWSEVNGDEEAELKRQHIADFELRLEDQARAFDACKRGSDISMTTLAHEMLKALYLLKARLNIDGDWAAAERAFNDHMKPHFEIRLW